MVRDAGLNRTCFFVIVEHHRLGKVTLDNGVRIRVVQFSHVGDVHFIGVGETFLNLREEISKITVARVVRSIHGFLLNGFWFLLIEQRKRFRGFARLKGSERLLFGSFLFSVGILVVVTGFGGGCGFEPISQPHGRRKRSCRLRVMFKGGAPSLTGMAQDLFEGEKVLAFDLETTGVSTNNDRIVQYALIGTLADGTAVNVEQLVKPGVRIPFDASNIHGIYDEDVRDKPRLSEVADELADLIDGAVLVGHNVRSFDFAMLKTEFLRMGRLAPQPKAIMDTLELVRRLRLPRPHNLGALCQRHGIRLEAAHTAAADAAATMLLFWRLSVEHAGAFRRSLSELERWIVHGDRASDASELGRGLDDLEPVDAMGKIREDGGELVLAFGRHRGRYLREVQLSDPSYIGWLLSARGLDCQETQERIKAHLRS